ncbi:MAG TPA: class I SAM-dependent methyltransferase [Alphaproteobacteria bacterium]|jgi:hypothetical protein|nr:class I SAM-dependent methyltransferase [Alphaproteobacteria bacterium]MDP6269307.1 class I SAM-dependent methyltransferase [Alphaproteobacteria bacterium]MDP7428144.1 class I SAM-dependent methyltransferase [Alphaproteobacteria bacterium]HJM50438.1 class I SAM-dependent methyltransferase [Alphaproteobacteria bacterium]
MSEDELHLSLDWQGMPDEEKFHELEALLQQLARIYGQDVSTPYRSIYIGDGLVAAARTLGFAEDPRFLKALVSAHRPVDGEYQFRRAWRFHTLCWAAEQALATAGDFVELGAYLGFSARVVYNYVDFAASGRRYYLFDTFSGTPEGMRNESFVSEQEYVAQAEEIARQRFAGCAEVDIVPGSVPSSIPDARPERIAFAHLDMISAAAEVAAMEKIWPRLSPGAVVIMQCYALRVFREQ